MPQDASPYRKRLDHEIPTWIRPESEWFFITVCARRRRINTLNLAVSWEAIRSTSLELMRRRRWFPHLLLAMQDHVHLLATFPAEEALSDVMRDWKRATSRFGDIDWQRGYFDHRLRSDESFLQKAAYIRNNPHRAGLLGEGEPWPYILEGSFEPGRLGEAPLPVPPESE